MHLKSTEGMNLQGQSIFQPSYGQQEQRSMQGHQFGMGGGMGKGTKRFRPQSASSTLTFLSFPSHLFLVNGRPKMGLRQTKIRRKKA